jgi:Protein of unknown function (DUF2384)
MATKDKKPVKSLKTPVPITHEVEKLRHESQRLREQARKLDENTRKLRITQKAESASQLFSLQDSEQSPAYKYGLCIAKLQDLFKTDKDVEEWLNSLESGLPKTPMQYMEEGKFEVVERLIGMIEHGIPS